MVTAYFGEWFLAVFILPNTRDAAFQIFKKSEDPPQDCESSWGSPLLKPTETIQDTYKILQKSRRMQDILTASDSTDGCDLGSGLSIFRHVPFNTQNPSSLKSSVERSQSDRFPPSPTEMGQASPWIWLSLVLPGFLLRVLLLFHRQLYRSTDFEVHRRELNQQRVGSKIHVF